MHNIILTESELRDLKCLIAETKEFKSTTITNPIIQKVVMYQYRLGD